MPRLPLLAALLVCAACPARSTSSTQVAAPAEPAGDAVRATPGPARGVRTVQERTVFHLHKFLLRVGVEVDTYVPDGAGGVEAKASFGFQDRGAQVTLAARYTLAADGSPEASLAWGRTSRISSIDEAITRVADDTYDVLRLGEDA
ncbi:MAG TPA: hypothetical protein VGB85_05650, partial [Nannocystis sp.]